LLLLPPSPESLPDLLDDGPSPLPLPPFDEVALEPFPPFDDGDALALLVEDPPFPPPLVGLLGLDPPPLLPLLDPPTGGTATGIFVLGGAAGGGV
jgi:hypothetical protein